MVVPVLFDLRAHVVETDQSQEPALVDRQHRIRLQNRKMFWIAYILDKSFALYASQPPLISDEFCSLQPPNDNIHEAARADVQQSCCMIMSTMFQSPWLASDLRLSILRSKALRFLHSVHATAYTGPELLRTIRELDDELEQWRTTMPSHLRPALSIPQFNYASGSATATKSMQHVIIHLEYLQLVGVIHCASRRYTTGQLDYDSAGKAVERGVLSSLELGIEASRSILKYLVETELELTPLCTWRVTPPNGPNQPLRH